MSPVPNPDSTAFVILDLARLFRAEFEYQVTQSPLTLSPAEARVLAHIARFAPARSCRVAASLGMSAMGVSEFTRKLAQAGYVTLRQDPTDQRAKVIELLPKADKALKLIGEISARIQRAARRGFEQEDWETFNRLALTLRGNLNSQGASRKSA